MNQTLEQIEREYLEIEQRMLGPEVLSDPAEIARLSRARSRLEEPVALAREMREIESQIEQVRQLLHQERDPELVELAEHEQQELEQRRSQCRGKLEQVLAPADPLQDKDVIMEVRAGAGGDEAALFAADLMRMYSRFAERRGWKVELLSASESGFGGFKEVVFSVQGKGAYRMLKHESGVHRVQRVPATEASGRIHTSTATVAVLPEAEDVDVQINDQDLKIDTYRASGPGGQHMQKNETAVRITHLPTGLAVACQDERSQLQNRLKAMRMLRAHLLERIRAQQEAEIARTRRGQIGSGERSEKIRTYNFPQSRLTDHRIGISWHNLPAIMEGELEPVLSALSEAERAKQLAAAPASP